LIGRNAYLSHTLDIASIVEAIHLIWADWQTKSLRTMLFEPISPEAAVQQILERVQRS
jgi:hypothetical protein